MILFDRSSVQGTGLDSFTTSASNLLSVSRQPEWTIIKHEYKKKTASMTQIGQKSTRNLTWQEPIQNLWLQRFRHLKSAARTRQKQLKEGRGECHTNLMLIQSSDPNDLRTQSERERERRGTGIVTFEKWGDGYQWHHMLHPHTGTAGVN